MKSTKRPVKQQKGSRISATWWIVGLIAVILGLGLITLVGQQQVGAINAQQFGLSLGSPTAPVKLEEYGDFQCPACGQFARTTLRQIIDKYVNTNQVQITFHNFAFIGQESIRAAEAAMCANDQNKFWDLYDTLFSNQAGENQGAFNDDKLIGFAQKLGLDMTQFQQCFSDHRHLAEIQADTSNGQLRGVQSTPTLFINKDTKILGAISLQQFEAQAGPSLKK
jgi:protein-disulfide isomerase